MIQLKLDAKDSQILDYSVNSRHQHEQQPLLSPRGFESEVEKG